METSLITLGRWTQNSGQPEPIQWLVLGEEENSLLCLSRFILDGQPYHRPGGPAAWGECTLRRWLGEDFFLAAFSPKERERLLPTPLKNPRGETVDRVFLLAPPEDLPGFVPFQDPEDYYSFPEDCALTTPYARRKGCWFVEEEGPDQYRGSWCIRYPRYLQGENPRPDYTSSVNFDGYIEAVAQDTGEVDGVRPAIRLSILPK